MNWAGFHLSAPHKVEVIKYLDGLGESAQVMGAVNCVVLSNGKLIGENTDGKGFLESLREIIDPVGKIVTILGAGGAARAIAFMENNDLNQLDFQVKVVGDVIAAE